jgi:hypothetical protein
MMMEAVRTSETLVNGTHLETLVNFNVTARRYIPEDS